MENHTRDAPTTPVLAPGAKIAIIGAGTIGVLAARQCLDYGAVPVVFEKNESVGGVWRYEDPPQQDSHSPAYNSLYTNSSRTLMNISDFPFPFETQPFPTRADICRYYSEYIDHFNLGPYINFGYECLNVHPLGPTPEEGSQDSQQKWSVTVRRMAGAATLATQTGMIPTCGGGNEDTFNSCDFDAVFLCTGQFWNPKAPTIPTTVLRTSGFVGEVSHSSHYRSPEAYRGKHVVIIGIGNSALDISLEIARAGADSVTLVCRGGTTIIPVADDWGRPVDEKLVSRFFDNTFPKMLKKIYFYLLVRAVNLDFHEAGLPSPPAGADAARGQFSNLKEHKPYRALLRQKKISIVQGSLAGASSPREIIVENRSSQSPSKQQFNLECDALMYCTGYEVAFPYLDNYLASTVIRSEMFDSTTTNAANNNGEATPSTSSSKYSYESKWLNLYKYIMHPQLPTLCAFGIVNSYGNESLVGEMQLRWALSSLMTSSSIPSRADREMWVNKRSEKIKKIGMKFTGFVLYGKYCDELAKHIGCSPPDVNKFSTYADPTKWPLLLRVALGPHIPTQYRLNGPHRWDGAEKFIVENVKIQPWQYISSIPRSRL